MKLRDYIKQREERTAQAERQFAGLMRSALRRAVKPVYERIEQGGLISLQNELPSLIDKTPITEAYRWLYLKWGVDYGRWFLRNFEFQGKQDFFEEVMEELFITKTARKIVAVYGTTLDLVQEAVQKVIPMANEGASIDRIQKAIRAEIEGVGGAISPGRATTIARTEVIGASNEASYESAKSTGLEIQKAWITGGVNIRTSHLEAEGQGWIPMNEAFQVGNHLMMYPGAPSEGGADNPEEVINCKCTLIYQTL